MTYFNTMKRRFSALPLVALLVLTPAACDFLDPTAVENPRTTEEDLEEALRPTAALLPGLRSQFARLVSSTVVLTEVISDNYSIHGTGLNGAYDFPRDVTPQIVNSTGTATGLYWNSQELRALADFVIDGIIPEDTTDTPEQLAEAHYYRGMAFLHLAENVVAAPTEEDGDPVAPEVLLGLAVDDLTEAAGPGEIGLAATAALARAHRLAGNATGAGNNAQAALDADPTFVFLQGYDRSSISNASYFFLVSRALREMQPLPRLDFLDPKYIDFDAPVPVAKAEEMHLILAEVDMSQNQWADGREHLAQAIEAAQARSTTSFLDDDPRVDKTFVIRPRDQEIAVAASPGGEARSGLVLERPGAVPVPTISGTSLNADSIRAIPETSEDALLHALYLARQEILFLEGRRMSDLGIRIPIMAREIDTNPNIDLGATGTVAVVPSYIPPSGEIDSYSPISPYPDGTAAEDVDVEPDVLLVEILHDMNQILVDNRSTALPLFGG